MEKNKLTDVDLLKDLIVTEEKRIEMLANFVDSVDKKDEVLAQVVLSLMSDITETEDSIDQWKLELKKLEEGANENG